VLLSSRRKQKKREKKNKLFLETIMFKNFGNLNDLISISVGFDLNKKKSRFLFTGSDSYA
jgi:hypothetical protein